jgi:hypothetical protein
MTNHKQETIKKLEATIKEAQFQIDELKKPKTNYPFNESATESKSVNGYGDIIHSTAPVRRHKVGNMFETKEKAERSNLYKLLNSEYDYWFPGFSEKPDFKPNGVEYWSADFQEWVSTDIGAKYFEFCVYRWKRSEN